MEHESTPPLTREQYDYVVKAAEADAEHRRVKHAVWERTAFALVWAVITAAAMVIYEWVKFKIQGLSE